ncbi:NmrA family NAD(P)-binding protein [Nonomuraea angiospora]|uniref:Uncharacterized protein YbjT (DUF2867 family) n=1 Tax=Nonomuraea angiospora TaxID=46172 RepID=A0ABR9LS93_9ACTN|nr:NmrA family NAD(P)-binding protein [Nonomuraea angiospora]MBE1582926.1 uncharacterized protein YbjT (DUF2867 family) [Nonomuraea angiospora]
MLIAGVARRFRIGFSFNRGAVADLLLERGHEVVAYVRSGESPAAKALSARGARLATGDLADPDALQRACTGADAVFGLSVARPG